MYRNRELIKNSIVYCVRAADHCCTRLLKSTLNYTGTLVNARFDDDDDDDDDVVVAAANFIFANISHVRMRFVILISLQKKTNR